MRLETASRYLSLLLIAAFTPHAFGQEVEYNWAPGGESLQWFDPDNWEIDDGTVPLGDGAIANINAGSPAFYNTAGGTGILTLNIGAGARLDIETGFLSFGPRTAARPFSMQNSGVLNVVGNSAEIRLRDQATNFSSAAINLDDGGKINIVDGDTTINTSNLDTGNGSITMGSGSQITGSGGATLSFVKQTIEGQGNIGNNAIGLSFDADTIVEANAAGSTLTVDAANSLGIVNQGTMRATSGGTLSLRGPIDNVAGLIEAQAGSEVALGNSFDITGGVLRQTGTGTFSSTGSGRLSNLTLAGASLAVGNGANLILDGTIDNQGELSLGGSTAFTDLQIDEAVTLTGGGMVTLNSANASRITDDNGGGVLTNVDNTIQGQGRVGNNLVQIVNQSGGTINANASGRLILDPGTGAALINRGLLTATGGGDLLFAAGDFDNADGLVDVGDDSTITLDTGSKIIGGIVRSTGTGSFVLNTGTLEDLTIEGEMDVRNGANLGLSGTISNEGNIAVGGSTAFTDLQIDNAVSLTGGGTVTLGASNASRITDDNGGGVLTNVDNAIQGQGLVGNGLVQIINEADGRIDGNDSTGTLTLNASAGAASVNRGLLGASNGGTLAVVGGEFDNSAGLIESGSESSITIGGTARIDGGVLNATDNSSINFNGSGEVANATLQSNGSGQYTASVGAAKLTDVVNESSIRILNGGNLFIGNTINNQGDISIEGSTAFSDLQIDEAVSLVGGGTVTLNSANASRITDDSGGGVLTNVDNTVQGKGLVGNGLVQIINEAGGTINGNDSTGGLTLSSAGGVAMINRGLLTASDGGNLRFAAGNFDNAGGLIEVGDDSSISLLNGSRITGGILRDNGTGSFVMGNIGTLEDLTIQGNMNVQNGGNLLLEGAINNEGNIAIAGSTAFSDLQIDNAVSLSGGGTVTLESSNASRITDDNGGGVLTNVDNTIRGAGLVGNGLVHVENLVHGTILADQSGRTLSVNSAEMFENFGTLAAQNNSLLNIQNATNNFGIVDADAGSEIRFGTLINGVGGQLVGDGLVDSANEIVNQGTISPGDSPGTLTLDADLLLGTSSTLEIELASDMNFDELIINGDVELGGALELVLLDGYTPDELDVFDVVLADSLSGSFANVADGGRLLTNGGAGSFVVSFEDGSSVRLSQFSVSAVPEPGSATFLILASVTMLVRRRRKCSKGFSDSVS